MRQLPPQLGTGHGTLLMRCPQHLWCGFSLCFKRACCNFQVLAKEGIAGLYSGVQAAFIGSIISSSVYFGTYELGKGILTSIGNCPRTLIPPVAAAIGNLTSSAILVPKEVIKQRMQVGMVGSALDVFLQTVRTEGVGGLYAGYSAALLRNLPSNIISFSTFVSMQFLFNICAEIPFNKSATRFFC